MTMDKRAARACVCGALALIAGASPAAAQSAPPTRLFVNPGGEILIASAPCVQIVAPPATGQLEIVRSDAKAFAIYRSPSDQRAEVTTSIQTGQKQNADKSCDAPTLKQFVIGVDNTPKIPDDALNSSFRILMLAFVLALLLESAFALLFNWRLFLEFFAGKAWRTPIMFVGALLVVKAFNLDLMARLFDAYNPAPVGAQSAGSWFTAILTAMVLAGGSAGVNRILVALGFRTQVRPETVEPKLEDTEAYIAVRVASKSGGSHYQVNVTEEAAGTPLPPMTVGFVRSRSIGDRLKNVLFQSWKRVPPSGGRTIRTDKVYSITVIDMKSGKVYDALAGELTGGKTSHLFRFGPRAIVDFEVSVP